MKDNGISESELILLVEGFRYRSIEPFLPEKGMEPPDQYLCFRDLPALHSLPVGTIDGRISRQHLIAALS